MSSVRKLFRGVKVRILLPAVIFLMAEAAFFIFLHHHYMEKVSQETGRENAQALFSSINAAIEHPMLSGDEEIISQLLTRIYQTSKQEVYITDLQGRISYASLSEERGTNIWQKIPPQIKEETQGLLQGEEKSIVLITKDSSHGELWGVRAIKNERACAQCHEAGKPILGLLVIKGDITPVVNLERASLRSFSLIAFFILAFSALALVVVLEHEAVSPIRRLCQKLRELASGEADLTRELPVKTLNCSEIMACDEPECRSYGKEVPCWYISGSQSYDPDCPKITKGEYQDCAECKVYQ